MKRILLIGLTLLNITSVSVRAEMIDGIDYRQAQESDVPAVVSVLEEASHGSSDKIIVPPIACREAFIREMIEHNHLFIATKKINGQEVVVATKKLFVAEGHEKKDILETLTQSSEERSAHPSLRGKISDNGTISTYPDSFLVPALGVYIYDGFEYTRELFQRKGINKTLTEVAYNQIINPVRNALQKSSVKNISLLFGLTHENAGIQPNTHDRTSGLAKTFRAFIKNNILHQDRPVNLELSRYDISMPVFNQKDPEHSTDCSKSWKKEKSIPAYGFILTYEGGAL